MVAGLLCIMLAVSIAFAQPPPSPPTTTEQITPTWISGNPTCEDPPYISFKIEPVDPDNPDEGGYASIPPWSGTFCDPADNTRCVVITAYSVGGDEENAFDFTSTFDVYAVIVKGGPNANLYEYDSPVQHDTNLQTPINTNTGWPFGLSHIDFCGIATPEFPTLALPVSMMIGIVGLVYVVKKREN